jgi:hypothetical protein
MFPGNLFRNWRNCRISLLAIGLLATIASCHRISPAERRIIGIWEFTGLDATGRVVFRSDHKIVDLFRDGDGPEAKWVPTSWGTWRLDGNEIVTDEEMLVGDYSASERRIGRIMIGKFEKDRLKRSDGRPDFYRVHSNAERRSQMSALLYVIGSVIAFSVCIRFAGEKPLFGKAVLILLVAASLAAVWSTARLVTELAQTGTAIVSPAFLSRLAIVSQVFGVAGILVFASGMVGLIFAIKRRHKL